jgi:oligopeptide transport system ATP-binding protein
MTMQPLLQVKAISKEFPVYQGQVFKKKTYVTHAVKSVSFDIFKGETFGLVGESGCGKTTVCRAILQLTPLTSGAVFFKGGCLSGMVKKELRQVRRHMQIVYQDPFASLNPRMKVRDIIGEPLVIHKLTQNLSEYKDRVEVMMTMVGLNPAMSGRYPHEFSGGQRQRISIARALTVNPDFLVLDEPVSSLDVSIQAQIINLLEEIREKFSLTYLFIAHDLAVVHHISKRVAVMYAGEIVEIADRQNLYGNPSHPYTKALLAALPIPDPQASYKDENAMLQGGNGVMEHHAGCKFYVRCPARMHLCQVKKPMLKKVNQHDHMMACHLGES